VIAAAFTAAVLLEYRLRPPKPGAASWSSWLVVAMALGSAGLVFVIISSHLRFPLSLEIMEGTVLQHFQRAASGRHIYTEPTGEFVALAYNPLYYYVSVPAGWVFGQTLFTLRFVSVVAYVMSATILFFVARAKTGSTWAGIATAGLFAAAYDAMDAYLDTAHSDACLLAALLLGTSLIDWNKSRAWNAAGVVALVCAFWFKQHGALFTIGGVLYLTWRDGLKKSWLYWVIAAVLGPGVYLGLGNILFGPRFHFFTFEIPGSWNQYDVRSLLRVLLFVLMSYPLLAVAAIAANWGATRRAAGGDKTALSVWHAQLGVAILSAIMGSLDRGSSNNVFIPMGAWLILLGSIELFRLGSLRPEWTARGVPVLAVLLSFAALLYDPMPNFSSPRAAESYEDLISELKGLNAQVYAPAIGQLESGYTFVPAAHRVALEDLVRGRRDLPESEGLVERIVSKAARPTGPAYLLSYVPLHHVSPELQFLSKSYVLEKDYGDRFAPLRTVPHRWDFHAPRYLFKYRAPATTQVAASE
jgi:hypothetical protein